jgi:hypothetical protein
MNIRFNKSDFSVEDFKGVTQIRKDWDGHFLIEVDDPSAEFGIRVINVYGMDVASIEIRP